LRILCATFLLSTIYEHYLIFKIYLKSKQVAIKNIQKSRQHNRYLPHLLFTLSGTLSDYLLKLTPIFPGVSIETKQ